MSRYKAYPEYKDSGVEWLEVIPAHWIIAPLKYIATFSGGGTPSKDNPSYWNGDIPWVSPKDMKTKTIKSTIDNVTEFAVRNSSTNLLDLGALLMVVRSGILQHSIPVAINEVPVTLNQDMKAIRFTDRLSVKFAFYLIEGNQKTLLLEWSKQGATVESIEQEFLANTAFPIPLKHEQEKIADFLDHETAKIDTLIAKQQELIKLLKEKRQAVISHAVTKGLNPNAPMRDSGVEWLGEVPEHWVVSKFKYLVVESSAGPYGSSLTKSMYTDSGVRVYGQQQVIPDDFTTGDYYISESKFESMRRYEVFPEDVLISVMGTVGKVAVVPYGIERGIINPRLVKYRVKKSKILPQFVKQSILSDVSQSQLQFTAQGSTMDGLNMQILGELPIAFPNLNEQEKILEEISRVQLKFSLLLDRTQKTVDLLSERRTALISAAVTGKIDVRDWQAPSDAVVAA